MAHSIKKVLQDISVLIKQTTLLLWFFQYADFQRNYANFYLGFSLYVSKTTDMHQGTLCFKDNHFTIHTLPAVFTTPCYVHGQYVIYYNERRNIYRRGFTINVYSNLCEVEVYGEQSIFKKSSCSDGKDLAIETEDCKKNCMHTIII